MVVDGVVDGLRGGAVLVHVQPEVDALDGQIAGQVGGEVLIEEAAAAGTNIEVEVTGAEQVVGAHGHSSAVDAVLGQGHGGVIKLVPGGGDLQAGGIQQILPVPHDLGVGVVGDAVGDTVHRHVAEGVGGEAVPTNGIDGGVAGGQHAGVDHLHHLAGVLGGADVGQVAGGDAGVPLGVEIAPGHGLNVDGDAGVVRHELVGGGLDRLHAGALSEGVPESDGAVELAGLAAALTAAVAGIVVAAGGHEGQGQDQCQDKRYRFFHVPESSQSKVFCWF